MLSYIGTEKEYIAGVRVVKNFTLDIAAGETVALVGPSGCGKTTVLKMANRLEEATKGEVFFRNDNVLSIEPVQLRRQIGYVIQQVGLFPHLSVGENIAFVLRLLGWGALAVQERVTEMLEMVGLPVASSLLKPSQLSGGQQQRVGVARALASKPDLVLMDEPFGALDPITRRQIQNQMLALKKTVKTSILLVTHDIQEAFRLADRIVIMHDGEILQVGEPEDLLCNPCNDYVREFIDSAFEYAHIVKQYQDDCQEKTREKIESTF